MATPDIPKALEQWMRGIESRIDQALKRDPFINSAFTVPGPGVTSVDGTLDSANYAQGSTGWALTSDGNAEFNALTLRAGIIGDDALTNPVSGNVANTNGSNFALTTSFVELAGADITIPAGFTTLLATAGCTVFSYNPNTTGGSNGAGGDAVYALIGLGGQQGHSNPVGVSGNGGYATSFSNYGFQFTNLTPGSTLRLSCYGASAYQGLAANSNNYANAYASLIWLR